LRDSSIPTSAEPEGGGGGPARPGEVVGSAAPGPASARATGPGSAFGRSRVPPRDRRRRARGTDIAFSQTDLPTVSHRSPENGPAYPGAGRNPSREAGWKDPSRGRKEGSGEHGDGEFFSLQKGVSVGPAPRGSANPPGPSPLQGSGRQAGKWLRDQRRRPAAAAFSWRKARPSRTRVAGLPTTSRHMQVARAMSGWRATKDSRTRAPW